MSFPLLFNLRLLALRPSEKHGGFFVDIVMSSMAGPHLDSAARFSCEFHPVADDGAHWGVYPPEVRSDSRFSLLDMLRGPTPDKPTGGEHMTRTELLTTMLSRTLNEFYAKSQQRAIMPHALEADLHNKVFALSMKPSDTPLVLRPTGIAQADLLSALAALSPELFSLVPRYYLEPTGNDPAKSMEMVRIGELQTLSH